MKQLHMNRTRKSQAGLSLIELMIALGIAMVVAAIALGLAAQVRTDNKVSQLQTQLIHVSTQAQSLSSGSSYAGITEDTLIDAKKVPDSWIVDNAGTDVIRHAFNGDITVLGAADGLTITAAKVPANACATLVNNTRSNFRDVTIGTTKVDGKTATPGSIATTCSTESATGDVVDLVFTV